MDTTVTATALIDTMDHLNKAALQRVSAEVIFILKRAERAIESTAPLRREIVVGKISLEDILPDPSAMERRLSSRVLNAASAHFKDMTFAKIDIQAIHLSADVGTNELRWAARFNVLPISPGSE